MELVFNIFLGLFLLTFFIVSMGFEGMVISTDKIGPNGFPQMVIMTAFVLLFFITLDLIKNKGSKKKDIFDINNKGFRIMVLNIVFLTAYIFSMNYIGFILSTAIYSLAAIWSMGYREKLKGIAFTLILTMSITLIFGKVFFVSLPRGIGILRELSYLIY